MHFVVADPLSVHAVIELLVVLSVRREASDQVLKVGESVEIQVSVPVSHLRDLLQNVREPVLRVENGGLVHIVPETLDPLVQKKFVLISKPVPRLFVEHIRKEGAAGPHRADKRFSILIGAEVSLFDALVVDRIALLFLDCGVDDRNDADVLLLHLLHETRKVGISLGIYREILKSLHIVDIEIDHIERDPSLAVSPHDFADILRVYIAPAALPVSESPQRSDITSPDQPAELPDHVAGAVPVDHIDVQIPV